jgi:alkylated DNA repair dioxygenase AlkB
MRASSARIDRSRQPDLFADGPALPEGFVYREDAISADEERRYADQFKLLPFAPFEFHGFLGRRRVVSFGWRYDYGKQRLREGNPLPDLLLSLRQRAADIAGLASENLKQALVTEYKAGAAIGWHRDKPMFGEVVALSFLSPCRLRLRRRRQDGWDRRALDVQPRSAYVLRGTARQEWEHSIPPVDSLRYSVTFRTLRES